MVKDIDYTHFSLPCVLCVSGPLVVNPEVHAPLFPQQNGGLSGTLVDLQGTLQDLSVELREERQGSQELTQQFAKAKASWEVERTELKSLITQVSELHHSLQAHTGELAHSLQGLILRVCICSVPSEGSCLIANMQMRLWW